jgi:hypothetical protein
MTNSANPERDEELSDAIAKIVYKWWSSGNKELQSDLEYIASFSARRATEGLEQRIKTAEVNARDRAIEECLASIGRPMLTPTDDFATQYRVISQQIVYDTIAKLKSHAIRPIQGQGHGKGYRNGGTHASVPRS